MKLGDVLRKEREKVGLSAAEMAAKLELTPEEYSQMEAGASAAETWGPHLAQIAITLETPTSRLLADSGRAADCRPGQAGILIAKHRERRGKSPEEVAEALGIAVEEYRKIEAGESPLERMGPLLLRFAEVIEQPVFNLFYPCGLPFQELDDYP
ncbi:MAG: helix-turn-helix domain-containing protein [Acidobacteria bacterium]|nr:MAG: helix-turn-helix domain-containing protein [Acidobacteriota bacterium]